jgi:WD40 repeat protein
MSRQRFPAGRVWLLFLALLLAACAPPPRQPANVVTALPLASPPPSREGPAPASEPITDQNAKRVAPLTQIGLGRLSGIALSPEGGALAVGSSAGVRLYDPLTLEVRSFIETGPVELLAYASDGALTTAAGRRVVKWNAATGQPVAETVQSTAVVALATSGGGTIALGQAPRVSERPEGFVILHRGADLAQLRSLPDAGARITAVSESRDGEWLAVAAGNVARLWPLSEEGPGITLRGHTDRIVAVAWSGSDRVVTAAADGAVRVWQASDGKQLLALDTLDDELTCVAVTDDGALIAAGSAGGGLHVWRADGELTRSFHARPGALRQIIFTPDGSGLLTAGDDQTLARWRTSDWQQVARKAGYLAGVYDVAFSPDGATLVTGAIRHGLVDLWRVSDGALLRHEEGHDGLGVNAVAYAPDGSFFATGGEDNLVRIWSADGQPARTLAGHTEYATGVAVSPDSGTVASSSYDKTIRLWRASDGGAMGTLQGHTSWVNAVAFSPDGRRLLSASYDRTARLWDVAAQRQIAIVGRYETDATTVAYAPDGRTMAVGLSAGGGVRLLDAEGAALRTLDGEGSEQVTGLSFSPDGTLLAVSYYQGEPVRLWRVADGALLATLTGPRDVFDLAFSPDGALLAAASGQGVVTLFGAQ